MPPKPKLAGILKEHQPKMLHTLHTLRTKCALSIKCTRHFFLYCKIYTVYLNDLWCLYKYHKTLIGQRLIKISVQIP